MNTDQPAVRLAANALWRMPGKFGVSSLLGPSYSLRCVVFHNISAEESPFTCGMGVNTTPAQLEAKLKFLIRYYTPVRLDDVLAAGDGHRLSARAVLVTFDDAYASVADVAAPLCARYRVPAIFFVNAAFLDNRCLAADNLVCYVVNEFGMAAIVAAVRAVMGPDVAPPNKMEGIFKHFLPNISLSQRKAFLQALVEITGIDESRMAANAGLYLTTAKLRDLARFDFELGNHTYSHVHCRLLDRESMAAEIDRNKDQLESLSRTRVRSFSVPYGSSRDLTDKLSAHLRHSGYEAVFLSESAANSHDADRFHLDRVGTRTQDDDTFFFELEMLPRLRALRNRYFRARLSARTVADQTWQVGRAKNRVAEP